MKHEPCPRVRVKWGYPKAPIGRAVSAICRGRRSEKWLAEFNQQHHRPCQTFHRWRITCQNSPFQT